MDNTTFWLMVGGWIFVLIWIPFVIATNRKTHPKALFILFFAEMWERFSYYGMRALLTLYMTKVLFAALADGEIKSLGIYGSYTAMVYLFPVVGGLIADRIFGFRKAVIWGGVLMALGHFALAIMGMGFEDNIPLFFASLALIIVGNGYFKPNISSFLGKFYDKNDPRKDGAFTIFYMGVNIGAFLSTLTCGYVGETISWHYGFGLAGIGMMIGLIVFWAMSSSFGNEGLPPEPKEGKPSGLQRDLPVYIGSLIAVPIVAFFLELDEVLNFLLLAASGAILGNLILNGIDERNEGDSLVKAGQSVIYGLIAVATVIFFPAYYGLIPETIANVNTVSLAYYGIIGAFALLIIFIVLAVTQKQSDELSEEVDGEGEDATKVPKKAVGERLLVIPVLFIFHALFWALFEQAGGSLTLFTDKNVDRVLFGSEIPASVFQSLNALFIILLAPVFSWMWIKLNKSGREPSTPLKFVLGLAQLALGFAIIVAGINMFASDEGLVPMIFLVLMYLFHTTGELSLSPVGLSMITKLSPTKIVGYTMGVWFLSISLANKMAGELGKLTATEGGGEGLNLTDSLAIYGDTYLTWGVYVVGGAALVLLMLVPILRKWMNGIH
ncbi:MAG: oligopeptide:H+ symporter [Bacteroidota bacterium]